MIGLNAIAEMADEDVEYIPELEVTNQEKMLEVTKSLRKKKEDSKTKRRKKNKVGLAEKVLNANGDTPSVLAAPKIRRKKPSKSKFCEDDYVVEVSAAYKARAVREANDAQNRKTDLKTIQNVKITRKNWLEERNSHAKRKFLLITSDGRKQFANATFARESEEFCVICNSQGSPDLPLISCQGKINGILGGQRHSCRSKFHANCLLHYNASDFNLQYSAQPECQNALLCPLHSCNCCYVERKKQSAFSGKLVECAICMRAFHYETCWPMGCQDLEMKIELDGMVQTIEMVICPSHYPRKLTEGKHISCCFECETSRPDEELIECKCCIRSFHETCKTIKKIDGETVDRELCETCLTGDNMRINSDVVVRWRKTQFFPGKVVYWDQCPEKLKKRAGYDKIGFCLVKWTGCEVQKKKAFTIVRFARMMTMFTSSLSVVGATKIPKIRSAWDAAINNLNKCVSYAPTLEKMIKEIGTAKYTGQDSMKVLDTSLPTEEELCDCEDNCVTNNCSNKMKHIECASHDCENRKISKQTVNKKITLRAAEDKGKGVFAAAPIKKKEFIAEYCGEILDKVEAARRKGIIKEARDVEAHLYMMNLNNGRVIDSARYGNISRFLNHSCAPNCEAVKSIVPLRIKRCGNVVYDYRIGVIALRDIQEDEELTLNYSMRSVEGVAPPVCKCNSVYCTGTLGGSILRQNSAQKMRNAVQKSMMEKTETRKNGKSAETDRNERNKNKKGSEASVAQAGGETKAEKKKVSTIRKMRKPEQLCVNEQTTTSDSAAVHIRKLMKVPRKRKANIANEKSKLSFSSTTDEPSKKTIRHSADQEADLA